MRSRILALMMLTAIIVAVLATAVGHAQNLNSATARLCNGLPYLCEKGFDEVTFPGNHNSGSGAGNFCGDPHPDCLRYCQDTSCEWWTCASSCWYRNQGKTITGQLEFGIRYFDIDVCICHDTLVTCHKEPTGPKIEQMLDEFDLFLNQPENRNEVIVLTFGDQRDNSEGDLQPMLYQHLLRWAPWAQTQGSLENTELTIFDGRGMKPGGPWPTIGDLVDTNQRIIVFVRDIVYEGLSKNIGVLSERDHIFDTWKDNLYCTWDDVTCNCGPMVSSVAEKCNTAPTDKLVLISAFCSLPASMCLSRHAYCCQGLLDDALNVCKEALEERIPNFIIADWTQNDDHKRNIVQVVKYFNQEILKEQDNALDISNNAASYIGFESNRNGKMISVESEDERIWFYTQRLTDKALWKWEKLDGTGGDLEYGSKICLQSKHDGRYLSSQGGDIGVSVDRSDDAQWTITSPSGSVGPVQAGDQICLYSVAKGLYVRAEKYSLKLESHCLSDEWWYVHADWNDSDEDRVIDEGDNCPDTYNPEQKDTDGDGVGDVCDPVANGGGGGGCLIGTLPWDL